MNESAEERSAEPNGSAAVAGKMRQKWDKFMCPYGIRRSFNPKKWERGTSVLVFGELTALAAAVAALWSNGRLLLSLAAIIGAGALSWYALDKSSLGEMPLTGTSATRIRAVVELTKTEDELGPIFDWDSITGDGQIVNIDLEKMKPEVKIRLARMVIRAQLQMQNPSATPQEIDQIISRIPDSEFEREVETWQFASPNEQ